MRVHSIGFWALIVCGATIADQPRSMHDYAQHLPQGMNVWLPLYALSNEDVDRWTRILGTSDEQRHFIDLMYERFVKTHNEYMVREAPGYCEVSAELGNLWKTKGANSPEFADLAAKQDRNTARVQQDLISLEFSLITSIEPILTEQQLECLPTVRYEAQRRNCRTVWRPARWVDIELRDVWEQTIRETASADVLREVENLLAEHEAVLTPIVCKYADVQLMNRRKFDSNRIAMVQGAIGLEEGDARYRRLLRTFHAVAVEIRTLNERTFDRIMSLLSEQETDSFAGAVKAIVFPEAYPDSLSTHKHFLAVLQNGELEGDSREVVQALFQSYSDLYKQTCNEIENFCIEWDDLWAQGEMGYQRQKLGESLKPLLEKRRELSKEWYSLLVETVGDDAIERLSNVAPVTNSK